MTSSRPQIGRSRVWLAAALIVCCASPCLARPPAGVTAEEMYGWLQPAELPKRALVFGIQDYKHLPRLSNARNDAVRIRAALIGLGFKVEQVPENLTRRQFGTRLDDFVNRSLQQIQAPKKAVVVFYFAGHGFHHGSRNFIVPADAPNDSVGLLGSSIPVSHIVGKLSGENVALAVVLLDACRTELALPDNQVNFSPPQSSGEKNIYYGFASQFGQPSHSYVAPTDINSPFAAALANYLPTQGQPWRRVFNSVSQAVRNATSSKHPPQHPIELRPLLGDYHLSPDNEYTKDLKKRLSAAFFDGPAHVKNYLDCFPAGPFSTGARSYLNRSGAVQAIVEACP